MANYRFFVFLVLTGFALTAADDLGSRSPSIAFIRLYNRRGSFEDAHLEDAVKLVSKINPKEQVVMFLHGATESVNADDVHLITSSFLNYSKVNVMALDYKDIAKAPYTESVQHIDALGKAVAEALERMIKAGVNRKKLYLIGHSLGAQVAGIIGRNLKHKIPRITGLDPAGPGFYLLNRHLSSSDADFVDIIHTNAGGFGLGLTTGSADFYPNFGRAEQPGCLSSGEELKDLGYCSHHRSWKFYAESIKNKDAFVGSKCLNGALYALGLCNANKKAIMGYATPPSARGKYYLLTNAKEPYGRGVRGAEFNTALIGDTIKNLIASTLRKRGQFL